MALEKDSKRGYYAILKAHLAREEADNGKNNVISRSFFFIHIVRDDVITGCSFRDDVMMDDC